MPLATFVRKRIKAVGLSQKEIAERAGVTPGFISELVLGKKQTVQERNLAKLAYALGCTPDDLIEAMAERPRYAVYVDEDPKLHVPSRKQHEHPLAPHRHDRARAGQSPASAVVSKRPYAFRTSQRSRNPRTIPIRREIPRRPQRNCFSLFGSRPRACALERDDLRSGSLHEFQNSRIDPSSVRVPPRHCHAFTWFFRTHGRSICLSKEQVKPYGARNPEVGLQNGPSSHRFTRRRSDRLTDRSLPGAARLKREITRSTRLVTPTGFRQ